MAPFFISSGRRLRIRTASYLLYIFPNVTPLPLRSLRDASGQQRTPHEDRPASPRLVLGDAADGAGRLSSNSALTPRRKRGLRSAITCFAKLRDQLPPANPMDLATIRQSLLS